MFCETPTRAIGDNQPAYIIAEAGVHHDGSLSRGYELIEAAKDAGADAIKFQTYKAETLVTEWAPRYWLEDESAQKGTQFDTFKQRDRFNLKDYQALADHAKKRGIDFLSTPFDNQAVDWLETIGIPFYKIASADHTNFPLLERIAQTKKPMALSVGAATFEEINQTVTYLKSLNVEHICLLHCVLSYPTPSDQAALGKITSLKKNFPNCLIGYSDHTIPEKNYHIQLTAISLGAKILEKHFTLDTSLPHDDHYHSFDPDTLKAFVRDVRELEQSIGTGNLEVLPCEKSARENARRSLVASRGINPDEVLTPDNLAAKRPGTGLSPTRYREFLGKRAKRELKKDELIDPKDFN